MRLVLGFPPKLLPARQTSVLTLFSPQVVLVRHVVTIGARTIYPASLLLGTQIVSIGLTDTREHSAPTWRELFRMVRARSSLGAFANAAKSVHEWRELRRDPYKRPLTQEYEPTIDTEPYALQADVNLPIALQVFSATDKEVWLQACLVVDVVP